MTSHTHSRSSMFRLGFQALVGLFLTLAAHRGMAAIVPINWTLFNGGNYPPAGTSTPGMVLLQSDNNPVNGTIVNRDAMWDPSQLDLTQPFDLSFSVLFGGQGYGCGADGMAFVLQTGTTSNLGAAAANHGYGGGLTCSLGVQFDTYPNPGSPYYDPNYESISLTDQGNITPIEPLCTDGCTYDSGRAASPSVTGTSGRPPILFNGADATDGMFHTVEIKWNPSGGNAGLMVYVDGTLQASWTLTGFAALMGCGSTTAYMGWTASNASQNNTNVVGMLTGSTINGVAVTGAAPTPGTTPTSMVSSVCTVLPTLTPKSSPTYTPTFTNSPTPYPITCGTPTPVSHSLVFKSNYNATNTVSIVNPAISNELMLIRIENGGSTTLLPSSVTYDGITATYAGYQDATYSGGNIASYYLTQPPAGTNNLVINYTSEPGSWNVVVELYADVDQATPIGAHASSTGSSAAFTTNITTIGPASLVTNYMAMAQASGVTVTLGGGQTSYGYSASDGCCEEVFGDYKSVGAAGPQTLTYNLSQSKQYTTQALEIRGYSSCTTPTYTYTVTATQSPSLTFTQSSTKTPTSTFTQTSTQSSTLTPSLTPTQSSTKTATSSFTPTPTPSFSPTQSYTKTATSSFTPSPTPSFSPTQSFTWTPSNTFTASPTPSFTPTQSSTKTATSTFSDSPTPSDTLTPSFTKTATPSFSASPTPSFSPTQSYTSTPTPTFSDSPTPSNTLTPSFTKTATNTFTDSPTPTDTRTPSDTRTSTPSWTASPSVTDSPTITMTPVPVPYQVKIQVFNSAGEVVDVLFNAACANQPQTLDGMSSALVQGQPSTFPSLANPGGQPIVWDGDNSAGAFVTGGVYEIQAQIIDSFGQIITLSHSVNVMAAPDQQSIRIYNSAGELVRQLTLYQPVAGASKLTLSSSTLMVGSQGAPSPLTLTVGTSGGGGTSLGWDGLSDTGLPVQTGVYTVLLVSVESNNAAVVASRTVMVLKGPDGASALETAYLAPNPSTLPGPVWLFYQPALLQGDWPRVELFNLNGELVAEADDPGLSGRIDVTARRKLAGGIYLARFQLMRGDLLHKARTLKLAVAR